MAAVWLGRVARPRRVARPDRAVWLGRVAFGRVARPGRAVWLGRLAPPRRVARPDRAVWLGRVTRPGARLLSGQGKAAVRLGRVARPGSARGLDWVHVGHGLNRQAITRTVPELLGLGFGLLYLLSPVVPGFLVRLRLVRARLAPLHLIGDRADQQSQGADPGQDQDQDYEVDDEPSRQQPVLDQGLDLRPLGRQLEPRNAQRHPESDGEADRDKGGETDLEKTPARALALPGRGVGGGRLVIVAFEVGVVVVSAVGVSRNARRKLHHGTQILTADLWVATHWLRDPPDPGCGHDSAAYSMMGHSPK